MQPTPRQIEIVKCNDPLVIVNTPPGSGKTFTVVEILQKAKGARVLATTFNKKAAAEIRNRAVLDKVGIAAEGKNYCTTIHSYCYDLLTERGIIPRTGLPLVPIADLLNYLLKRYQKEDPVLVQSDNWLTDDTSIDTAQKELLYAYEMSRICDVDPIQWFDKNFLSFHYCQYITDVRKLYVQFVAEKTRNNWFTFADLLFMCRNMLADTPEVFDYVIVDEAQDVDLMQIKILQLLMQHVQKQTYLIGDEDQKIYTFRGADHTPLVKWQATRIPLDKSWRIPRSIAIPAKRLISNNTERIPKDWEPADFDGEFRVIPVSSDESTAPISYILDRFKNTPQITILSRTNYDRVNIARALTAVGEPVLFGTHSFAFANEDARNAMKWLDYFHNQTFVPLSQAPRAEFFRTLAVSLHRVGKQTWQNAYVDCCETKNDPAYAALSKIMQDKFMPLETLLQGKEEHRIDCVGKILTGQESNRVSSSFKGIYLRHKDDYLKVIKNPAIEATTIHGFKGREKTGIVILGANNGKIPHSKSRTNIEEERRLFYVAITRAKEWCDVFYNISNPSPFLCEL